MVSLNATDLEENTIQFAIAARLCSYRVSAHRFDVSM